MYLRIGASSSATRTVVRMQSHPLRGLSDGQGEDQRRASTRSLLGPYAAVLRAHNAPTDGQPETGTRLGWIVAGRFAEKWIEDAFQVLGRDAEPPILDAEHDGAVGQCANHVDWLALGRVFGGVIQ